MASLNIRLGRAGGLEVALRVLRQGNVGVGFLQDKKLTYSTHTWYGAGYAIWVTETEIRHQVGVSVVWREAARWQF